MPTCKYCDKTGSPSVCASAANELQITCICITTVTRLRHGSLTHTHFFTSLLSLNILSAVPVSNELAIVAM